MRALYWSWEPIEKVKTKTEILLEIELLLRFLRDNSSFIVQNYKSRSAFTYNQVHLKIKANKHLVSKALGVAFTIDKEQEVQKKIDMILELENRLIRNGAI